jgi:hypothetical protein
VTSWRPLGTRVKELPLIICGPIVRRVEPQRATVFIALTAADTVTLTVCDSAGQTVGSNGGQQTVQLGDNLHVLAATATPVVGSLFAPGVVYAYQLEFQTVTTSTGKTGKDNFASAIGADLPDDLKIPLDSISYPARTVGDPNSGLPTLCLPADKLADVRMVHTSCRKAHGEMADSLPVLDTVLADATKADDPARARPQLLLLTGDQWYSDDVADSMLAQCTDAAGWLMGARKEAPPARVGGLVPDDWSPLDIYRDQSAYQLPAGALVPWRTDDHDRSRWPGVGFRGMHAFAAGYTVSSPDRCLADELTRITKEWHGKFPLHPWTLLGDKAGWAFARTYSGAANHLMLLGEFYAMALLSWSPLLWDRNPAAARVPMPYVDDLTREQFSASFHTDADKELAGKRWDKVASVRQMYAGLVATRRALANIATYMVFDDHDTTDDWFMNREWCERVLRVTEAGRKTAGNTLGVRMVRNALVSYAVFQAWGNTPERFAAGTSGAALLADLGYAKEMSDSGDLGALDELTQDQATVSNYVGVPWYLSELDGATQTSALVRSPRALTWDYSWRVGGWPFELLVTDCRTVRAYEKDKLAPPVLLDPGTGSAARPNQFARQIAGPDRTASPEVTLVVVQTPLVGVRRIETLQGLPLNTKWVFDRDQEAWGLSAKAQQGLLARLLAHNSTTIVLSGDVHYTFAQTVDYRATRPYGDAPLSTPRTGRLVQLTSSSAHNEAGDTRNGAPLAAFYSGDSLMAGNSALRFLKTGAKPTSVAALRAPEVVSILDYQKWFPSAPDWVYWTRLVSAPRSATTQASSAATTPAQHQDALMERAKLPSQTFVIGENNLCLIDFTGAHADTGSVRQTALRRPDTDQSVSTSSARYVFTVPLQYRDV